MSAIGRFHRTSIFLFCIDLSSESYRGLCFNRTQLPLFQNLSVKNYIFSFLQEVKTIKDKMKEEIISSYLAEQFGVIPIATRVIFLAQELKML